MGLNVLVIDTNVLLDVWVFDDPRTDDLREALQARRVDWLTTPAMREEWLRVLHYPHLHARWTRKSLSLDQLMAHFDRSECVAEAPRAPWACKDPDDQKFVDLAVAHASAGVQLISKDFEVLRMRKRLAQSGVRVLDRWWPDAPQDAMLEGLSLGESSSSKVLRA